MIKIVFLVENSHTGQRSMSEMAIRDEDWGHGPIVPLPWTQLEVLMWFMCETSSGAYKALWKDHLWSPGPWACEDSPEKYCQYNVLDDPAMDHCIHCGHPLERK